MKIVKKVLDEKIMKFYLAWRELGIPTKVNKNFTKLRIEYSFFVYGPTYQNMFE